MPSQTTIDRLSRLAATGDTDAASELFVRGARANDAALMNAAKAVLPRRRLSTTEVAKEIRKVLKRTFRGIRFYVRSDKYSGGSSINVNWTNGPTVKDVERAIAIFEGSYYDGMQDLKVYNGDVMYNGTVCRMGVDFIFCVRHRTRAMIAAAVSYLEAHWGEPMGVEIRDSADTKGQYKGTATITMDRRISGLAASSTLVHRLVQDHTLESLGAACVKVGAVCNGCGCVAEEVHILPAGIACGYCTK